MGAGVPAHTPTGQYVHGLVNKGDCFPKFIEFNPEVVQAGPLLDVLLDEMLGKYWISDSFLAMQLIREAIHKVCTKIWGFFRSWTYLSISIVPSY